MGAYLADIYVQQVPRWWMAPLLQSWSWPVCAAISLTLGLIDPVLYPFHVVLWVGPAVCFLLMTSLIITANSEIPGVSYVGSFSYSLYLVHPVALAVLAAFSRFSGAPLLRIASSSVFALFSAWCFFLLVEHRFLSKRQAIRYQQIQSSTLSTPPPLENVSGSAQ